MHVHTCTHTYTHMHTHAYMHAHTRTHTYMITHAHTYSHTYTYTHEHTYHTHAHTCKRMRISLSIRYCRESQAGGNFSLSLKGERNLRYGAHDTVTVCLDSEITSYISFNLSKI